MRSCDPVKDPGLPDQYWTTLKSILWVGFFFSDAAPMETLVLGTYDITGLRRGNSFRRTFRFKDGVGDPVDLAGSVLVFVVEAGAVRLVKSTADGSLAMPDPSTGEITLTLTPAETRQLPVGRLRARYEIERRMDGDETTLVAGCITVMDGINDDSGDH